MICLSQLTSVLIFLKIGHIEDAGRTEELSLYKLFLRYDTGCPIIFVELFDAIHRGILHPLLRTENGTFYGLV